MPQDRETGAAAARWGLDMGRRLARLLGAELVRGGSNEVRWDGRTAVIKSCRPGTPSFGITRAMLDRLDCALVGIEDDAGAVDVYELPIEVFRSGMRDSHSGNGDGRVQLLARAEAERRGKPVARYSASDIGAAATAE